MERMALYVVKMFLWIAVISGVASFALLYPYYLEVKSVANMMALQFAHDGYVSSELRDTIIESFESETGMLGIQTVGANSKVDASRNQFILPSFIGRNPIQVDTYTVSGNDRVQMGYLSSTDADTMINNAILNGTPVSSELVANRDTQFVSVIRTNYRLETTILGKTYVAILPVTVSTPGLTIKEYRW